jgi:hypothetical protein
MKYNINVSNFGGKHGESVIINDVLASTLSLRVNQAGGPFTVTNNAWLTSLTYSYVSLGDNSDDVAFDNGSGLYDYTPVADANGMDSNVRAFSISFGGIFNATAGANTPTMNIEFETRIK